MMMTILYRLLAATAVVLVLVAIAALVGDDIGRAEYVAICVLAAAAVNARELFDGELS